MRSFAVVVTFLVSFFSFGLVNAQQTIDSEKLPDPSAEFDWFKDVVYWCSQKEKKFAIAIFFGNTSHGTGTAPTAASPCIRFATIVGDCAELELIGTGAQLKLSTDKSIKQMNLTVVKN